MTWLVPHTNGPVSAMPATRKSQFSLIEMPDDTTPHMKAHIGGNQVTGLVSSTILVIRGRLAMRRGISGEIIESDMHRSYVTSPRLSN